MSNRNQDIAMRRRELQTQYNAIEGATISSLFRSRTNIWRWSKMALLRGVMLEHENLKDEFRNAIAEKISTVVALRKEISTYSQSIIRFSENFSSKCSINASTW